MSNAARQVYLAARVRPFSEREVRTAAKCVALVEGDCTTLVNPTSGDAKAYVLDHSYDSFDPNSERYASNAKIFAELGHLAIDSAWEGVNCSLWLSGQSGSGKSYTAIGNENDPGLIPRLLERCIQLKQQQERTSEHEVELQACFMEIKADQQVCDLLVEGYANAKPLRVVDLPTGGVNIRNLRYQKLQNISDCEALLASMLSIVRTIDPSSHTCFQLHVTRRGKGGAADAIVSSSKISVAEMASSSSETVLSGIMKSGPTPQDKTVLAWANVMGALAEQQVLDMSGIRKKIHVPYRSFVLTRILRDSISGNSRCIIIATVSPAHTCYKETLNTFRCVVRAKEVKRVAPNQEILSQYMEAPDFVPAAGGGWRWVYSAKDSEEAATDGLAYQA